MEQYENLIMEIIFFDTEDVLITSDTGIQYPVGP